MCRTKQTTDAIFQGRNEGQPATEAAVDGGEGGSTAGGDVAAQACSLLERLQSAVTAAGLAEVAPVQHLALEAEMRVRDWQHLTQAGSLPLH